MEINAEVLSAANYIMGAVQGEEYMRTEEGGIVFVSPESYYDVLQRAETLARFILNAGGEFRR